MICVFDGGEHNQRGAEWGGRVPKPHTGFDQFANDVVAVYEANRGRLEINGLDGETVLESLRATQLLRTMKTDAQTQLTLIEGTQLHHASIVWSAMLEIYDRAKSVGRTEPEILHAIAPFAHFMKLGARKKSEPAPVGTVPTATGG